MCKVCKIEAEKAKLRKYAIALYTAYTLILNFAFIFSEAVLPNRECRGNGCRNDTFDRSQSVCRKYLCVTFAESNKGELVLTIMQTFSFLLGDVGIYPYIYPLYHIGLAFINKSYKESANFSCFLSMYSTARTSPVSLFTSSANESSPSMQAPPK